MRWRRYYYRTRCLVLWIPRMLHGPSVGRHVHDADVHIFSVGVHKLRERIARHRSAPGYGLPRLGELPHGKHGHVIGIGNRNELLVLRLWLCILTAQEAWLGRAINIGVNQPYLHSEPFERTGKIRRQSRFPDPTLSAAHRDQAQPLPFPRHADAAVGHVLERFRSEEHTSELQSLMRISYAVF